MGWADEGVRVAGRVTSLDAATTGWVLSSFREHAADRGLRTAAGLARATGVNGQAAVHRSQLGRWESGTTPATYSVFRRYETVLGLPRGLLTSVVDVIARGQDPRRPGPAVHRPDRDDWRTVVIELVEKALSSDRMTGVDWDDLSAELAKRPDVVLRGRDWEQLIARVTLESEVTSGLECTFRTEASARLAGHPRSAPHVVELARRALEDPSSQLLYAVDLLKYARDTGPAAKMLVEAVTAPGDRVAREMPLWMSLSSLETLARIDGLTLEQRVLAGTVALDLLRDDTLPMRMHRGAASFLDAIDPPTRHHIVSALRHEQRSRLARVVQDGSILTTQEVEATAARVEERAAQRLGPWQSWPEPLRALFGSATSAAHVEERGMALDALKLLPQGAAIGSAYAAELRGRMAAGQLVVADDVLARLSWLVQAADVPYLLELMTDPTLAPIAIRQAANAVGNAPLSGVEFPGDAAGPGAMPTTEVVARVEASARRWLEGPGPPSGPEVGPVARGHCYVLGMHGRFDRLAALDELARQRGAGEWSLAAGWYLALPHSVRPLPLR